MANNYYFSGRVRVSVIIEAETYEEAEELLADYNVWDDDVESDFEGWELEHEEPVEYEDDDVNRQDFELELDPEESFSEDAYGEKPTDVASPAEVGMVKRLLDDLIQTVESEPESYTNELALFTDAYEKISNGPQTYGDLTDALLGYDTDVRDWIFDRMHDDQNSRALEQIVVIGGWANYDGKFADEIDDDEGGMEIEPEESIDRIRKLAGL